jgi:hypothetical protein
MLLGDTLAGNNAFYSPDDCSAKMTALKKSFVDNSEEKPHNALHRQWLDGFKMALDIIKACQFQAEAVAKFFRENLMSYLSSMSQYVCQGIVAGLAFFDTKTPFSMLEECLVRAYSAVQEALHHLQILGHEQATARSNSNG